MEKFFFAKKISFIAGVARLTFLLTGEISLRFCIAGSKNLGLFFFKYDIIDVNFGVFFL